jgi:hypothetical protein
MARSLEGRQPPAAAGAKGDTADELAADATGAP